MNLTVNETNTQIVLRAEKNAELTFAELDNNFSNLASKSIENKALIDELLIKISYLEQLVESNSIKVDTFSSRIDTIKDDADAALVPINEHIDTNKFNIENLDSKVLSLEESTTYLESVVNGDATTDTTTADTTTTDTTTAGA